MILPLANAPRQAHAGAVGHPRLRAPLRPPARRACGCPRRRSTPRRWRCWPSAGIRFTVLAPHQAARVRPLDGGGVADVAGAARPPRRLPLSPALRALDRPLLLRRGDCRRRSRSSSCWTSGERFAERLLASASPPTRRGRSSSTSPPTARPTATTTATARWRSPARCSTSSDDGDRATSRSPTTREFLAEHPPEPGGRDRRGHVVELRPRRRAVAQRLRLQHRRRSRAGTRPGGAAARRARLAARRAWRRSSSEHGRRSAARSVGGARRLHRGRARPLAPSRSTRFFARHAGRRRWTAGRRERALSSCSRCSATRCSCTRAAGGSSTSSRASRRCRSCATPAALSSSPRSSSTLPLERAFLERLAAARSNLPEQGDGRADLSRGGGSRPGRSAEASPPTTRISSLFQELPAGAPPSTATGRADGLPDPAGRAGPADRRAGCGSPPISPVSRRR